MANVARGQQQDNCKHQEDKRRTKTRTQSPDTEFSAALRLEATDCWSHAWDFDNLVEAVEVTSVQLGTFQQSRDP